MTNQNNEFQKEEQNEKRRDDLTLEEARALGSAEINAMTFTPPGGVPMTLDEYARHSQNSKSTGENS